MTKEYKRVLLLLSAIGIIIGANKKPTNLQRTIEAKIRVTIDAAKKQDKTFINDLDWFDGVFETSKILFTEKLIEASFLMSFLTALDEKRFKKGGLGRGTVAKFYKPLKVKNSAQIEADTREVGTWYYNKISNYYDLKPYEPKKIFIQATKKIRCLYDINIDDI
ncbi:hypothetical protein [Aquamicrobium sp.]|uniref:hypothetical protein n=1 Tax=Aquamicrobium sp. TaxID=1872579 RepID=UPI002590EB10|nr:hypothetical protein [Aquamicrobium sp.]MCK9549312.1 hypothetical protein [Aquamicrobium sp.]